MSSKPILLKELFLSCRRSFIFIGIFSLIVNLLMLTTPIYLLQIFDHVLANQTDDTLLYLTLIAIGATMVIALLNLARSQLLLHVNHWLEIKLNKFVLLNNPDERLRGGDYAEQSLQDITTVNQFLKASTLFAAFDILWTPIYLFFACLLQPYLGAFIFIGAISIFFLSLLNQSLNKSLLENARSEHAAQQQIIRESLENAEAIQAMGMLTAVTERAILKNKKTLVLKTIAKERASLFHTINLFIKLSFQLLILAIGAYLVINNKTTLGAMIVVFILSSRVFAPLQKITLVQQKLMGMRAALSRLKKYFEQPFTRSVGVIVPKIKDCIRIENVTYISAQNKKPIVKNISFQISPGEILLLTGPSGAGKSTLARLLLGIWKPTAGTVSFDGVNVYEWDRHELGLQAGYLPQDVELFHATIRENIARMTEGSDDAIIRAAKIAGIHEMVLTFPNGYDLCIDAFNLSIEQRQRIALARAFYGDPRFIVLDEPNINLEEDGEIALKHAIRIAREKKIMMVVISHRLNLLKYVDKVAVLNYGRMQLYADRDAALQELQKNVHLLQE